jgi:hypothetical protein
MASRVSALRMRLDHSRRVVRIGLLDALADVIGGRAEFVLDLIEQELGSAFLYPLLGKRRHDG